MTTRRRPRKWAARRAIREFLDSIGVQAEFDLIPDGDKDSAPGKCGWAFWITESDTTSYIHEDLSIEWYGTTYQGNDAPEGAEEG